MPAAYEQLREQLRYRSLIVRTSVLFKNKSAGLLIENGVRYETRKLHGGKKYFTALFEETEGHDQQLQKLLSFNRSQLETLTRIDGAIVAILRSPWKTGRICERCLGLMTALKDAANRSLLLRFEASSVRNELDRHGGGGVSECRHLIRLRPERNDFTGSR